MTIINMTYFVQYTDFCSGIVHLLVENDDVAVSICAVVDKSISTEQAHKLRYGYPDSGSNCAVRYTI